MGPATWDAIVSEAQFAAVTDRLEDPRRKTRGESTARKHLGSGLYFCSCGLRVRSSSGMGNGLHRYNCRHTCFYRSAAPVDAYVLRVIRERLAQPDLRELLVEPGDKSRLAELSAERKELQHRLAATEADYDNDIIDGHRFKTKRDKINTLLDAIRAEEVRLVSQSGPDSVLSADDPVAAFDVAPLGIKQQTIDSLAGVTLLRAPRGSRYFDHETVQIVFWRQ